MNLSIAALRHQAVYLSPATLGYARAMTASLICMARGSWKMCNARSRSCGDSQPSSNLQPSKNRWSIDSRRMESMLERACSMLGLYDGWLGSRVRHTSEFLTSLASLSSMSCCVIDRSLSILIRVLGGNVAAASRSASRKTAVGNEVHFPFLRRLAPKHRLCNRGPATSFNKA